MIWNKEMECADRETMRALQLEKLKKTVKHGYENVPHYKEAFDKAGVKPEDIQTLEDILNCRLSQKKTQQQIILMGYLQFQ